MPANKSQHYVPRCYLKPFTLMSEGNAINLFNIASNRTIPNVAAKGQCAKDYFYGKDLRLEKALQIFEGEYARILKIIQRGECPTDLELATLKDFSYLQFSRTEMAMKRRKMVREGMRDTMQRLYGHRTEHLPEFDLSANTLMLESMKLYLDTKKVIEDLGVCILENGTRQAFITSDDPAIVVSKFQSQKIQTNSFGLGSSGILLFLPLSPKHVLLCYDSDVYYLPESKNNRLIIKKRGDICLINELQYIKSSQNIYFSDWNSQEIIKEGYAKSSHLRSEDWVTFEVSVPIQELGKKMVIRPATDIEKRNSERLVISHSNKYPVPSKWPSIIQYRLKPRAYSDGSLAGYVRKSMIKYWQETERF